VAQIVAIESVTHCYSNGCFTNGNMRSDGNMLVKWPGKNGPSLFEWMFHKRQHVEEMATVICPCSWSMLQHVAAAPTCWPMLQHVANVPWPMLQHVADVP
jgi:hypothetical protein